MGKKKKYWWHKISGRKEEERKLVEGEFIGPGICVAYNVSGMNKLIMRKIWGLHCLADQSEESQQPLSALLIRSHDLKN